MTNEQVRQGFAEVYNSFWCRYKDRQPGKDSAEWERIHTYGAVLRKKYPFLAETVTDMVVELDRRMRERRQE